jgi:hypothetical protein
LWWMFSRQTAPFLSSSSFPSASNGQLFIF